MSLPKLHGLTFPVSSSLFLNPCTYMALHPFSAGGLVSYDDERSICEKTEYVIDNEVGFK